MSKILTARVSRLSADYKSRKFRKNKQLLEEKEFSCSQFSVLQSGDSESLVGSQDMFDGSESEKEEESKRPTAYKKRPLNSQMNHKSRNRRVVEKREVISQWAENEGVSVSKLLGYLLYLENYHSGDRSLADAGWRIFSGDQLAAKLETSLEEALWLIERACLSQSLYLEIRLRFLDRFVLPAVMHIVKESKLKRPPLTQ